MRPTIIFSTTNALISRLIRIITNSTVSHCALSFDIEGTPMVLHATVGGVILVPRAKFDAENTVVEEYQFVDDVTPDIQEAMKSLGAAYDYVGILGFGFVILLRNWLAIKAKNPLASSNATVCSEFVVSINKHLLIESWANLDGETISCEDLLKICKVDTDNFIKVR